MDVQDVAVLTATAALMANAAAILVLAGLAVGPRIGTVDRAVWWVRDHAMTLAALVAFAATLGSLYYSEIADFEPCRYCWFQRIAMYPIVVVAGVAAWRRDEAVRLTVGILAGMGLCISTWHWLIQHNPQWASESSCSVTAPCTSAYVEEFGFVTIPWMAGSGFLLIITLMLTGFVLREEVPR